MSNYFINTDDLEGWVKSRDSYEDAAQQLMDIIYLNVENEAVNDYEQDVFDSCKAIYEEDNKDQGDILMGILAKYNITSLKKTSNNKNKKVIAESRQRNGYERGMRNKWNRVVYETNEGTLWRLERDKFYNFTHNAPDAIKFDDDPDHIYSGEAIWRMYIMDKFYRDYKDANGRVVGGYINDRFQVFHDVSGNQMELADGERTRKPRPHQYSMERRLEEARGNKLKSITASSSQLVKLGSNKIENLKEASSDRIYNMFKDVLDMQENGISLEDTIKHVSAHYNASILGVSQINHFATNMLKKHDGVLYEFGLTKEAKLLSDIDGAVKGKNLQIIDEKGAQVIIPGHEQEMHLVHGTIITQVPNAPSLYEIVEGNYTGVVFSFKDPNVQVEVTENIQDAADELGLNENDFDDSNILSDFENTENQVINIETPENDFNIVEI